MFFERKRDETEKLHQHELNKLRSIHNENVTEKVHDFKRRCAELGDEIEKLKEQNVRDNLLINTLKATNLDLDVQTRNLHTQLNS